MDDDIFDANGRIRNRVGNTTGFNEKDYDLIKDYLLETTGISLGDTKKNMAYTRLSKHLKKTGAKDLTEYLNLVKRSPAEWQQFVNALTTNLTSFFREPHHFSMLTDHIKQQPDKKSVHVWCAASSTGEEVWSIAMTLADAVEARLINQFEITATDIDTSVLEQASKAEYTKDAVGLLSVKHKQHYFDLMPSGNYQISATLKSKVKFMQLNLISPQWPIHQKFDYIFCRNVMIYFERPLQISVFNRLANYITPKGLLFVGHSENFVQVQSQFKLLGRTVYERE